MQFHLCPDCETGWRYADELPGYHGLSPHHGLVRCPTCGGTGRLTGQHLPVRFSRAAGRS